MGYVLCYSYCQRTMFVESCRDNGQTGFDCYISIIILSFVYPFLRIYRVQPNNHYASYVGYLSSQLHSLFNVRSNAMIPPAVSLGTAISWSSRVISRLLLLFWISL